MELPIGSIVKVEKNSQKVPAVIVSYHQYRLKKYGLLIVSLDKKANKYRNVTGESVYYTNIDSFIELDNIWALGTEQISSLLHGAGINSQTFWQKMAEENYECL